MPQSSLGSPCCWLYLCCPPPAAARALASEIGISFEAATKVLDRLRPLPLDLEPTAARKGTAQAQAASERLVELNRTVRRELRQIIFDLGYLEPPEEL